MSYQLIEILSYVVGIPALLAWLRWPTMDRRFVPFVLLLTAGILTEVISTITINIWRTNAVPYHLYALVEAGLILWQFKYWGLFARHRRLFPFLLLLVFIVWSIDNIFLGKIVSFDSYYTVVFGFLIALLSVQQVNLVVVQDRTGVLKNAVFQICMAFIIFFTYKTLVEIFYIYGLTKSDWFSRYVYRIMTFVNVFVNLLFAVSVLWIPRKQTSLLQ